MLLNFCLYMICGSMVGFLGGLFGIGGGIIGIPFLLFIFKHQGFPPNLSMHYAAGTFFASVLITCILAIRSHYHRGNILFPIFKKIVPGVIAGNIVGVLFANQIQGMYLQRIFGVFLILVALHMMLTRHKNTQLQNNSYKTPHILAIFFTTFIIGIISGLLGLGGGLLLIPYLLSLGINMRQAIATTITSVFPAAIFGTIGYMLVNIPSEQVSYYHLGYVYWPAFIGMVLPNFLFVPLGVKANQMLSKTLLQKIFFWFLFLIGIAMLL